MDNILSKSTTNALKGISAIEIMIGHLGIATGWMLLYPNRKAGILFVGLFFFISGYGLMFSYLRNKNYLKNFLIKKVVIIIVPAYLVYLLNGVFELIQTHGTVTTGRVLEYIFLKEFFYRTNWYIFECLAFYILFWMLYKFLNKKHATVLLWIITLVFIATAFQMKVGNWC